MIQSAENARDLPDLLALVRSGDEAALLQLLTQYEHRMRAAARVLLGNLLRPHLDSLDVVQSVYCALLPGLRAGRYELSSSNDVMALALGVLRRKIARKWRRVRREQPQPGSALGEFAAQQQPAATERDPAAVALANDQLRRLTSDLGELDRRLVELRVQGYRIVEIAEKMGCGAGALRARLSRLRQRFRRSGYQDWL